MSAAGLFPAAEALVTILQRNLIVIVGNDGFAHPLLRAATRAEIIIARMASHFAAVRATENLTMEGTAPQFAADASHLAGIGDTLAAVRSPFKSPCM